MSCSLNSFKGLYRGAFLGLLRGILGVRTISPRPLAEPQTLEVKRNLNLRSSTLNPKLGGTQALCYPDAIPTLISKPPRVSSIKYFHSGMSADTGNS